MNASKQDDFTTSLKGNPLATVAAYYASCLATSATSAKATEYIKAELKLNEQQTTERQIGFADRTLGTLIPHRRIKQGRQLRDMLIEVGLYKANGHETMRGHVTEPIVNDEGTMIGLRIRTPKAKPSSSSVNLVSRWR